MPEVEIKDVEVEVPEVKIVVEIDVPEVVVVVEELVALVVANVVVVQP